MIPILAAVLLAAPPTLQLDYTRESLTATYRHYRQVIDGREVVGGERIERTRDGVTAVVYERLAAERGDRDRFRVAAANCASCVYVNFGGEARLAHRAVVAQRPLEPHAIYTDAETGAVLRDDPLFFTAKARVFDVNPVAKLNDPSLRDQSDSAAAVPEAAYSVVEIPNLSGPNAKIVDTQAPFTAHADPSQSLEFNRSQPQFEEVNAYFQIDRTQRYLQSLGYTGARQLVAYPIPIDPHAANGTDNSFYLQQTPPGHGALFFGDGGTDDAEDPDIMLHEFFHSVQDWLAPGALAGQATSEARALAEGGADYWSFSSSYEATAASGRDPYCIADWDARCAGDDPSQQCGYAPGTDCLRRVDSPKTMSDFNTSPQSGVEYENSAIWSSALREVFLKIGKKKTDTLVVESHFGIPPLPTFKVVAQKMIEADVLLFSGADATTICSAMTSRGIMAASECIATPRGEWTYFLSHFLNRLLIPDGRSAVENIIEIQDPRAVDRVAVHVDIDHPVRGDLVITLIAPNGVEVPLKEALDVDRTPGLHVTFGIDAPAPGLDQLRGISAAGVWRLRVQDVFPQDAGVLLGWSVILQFAGDTPLARRPTAAVRRIIPAVAHIAGVGGLTYVTDLRLLNRNDHATTVTLVFTPSHADGTQTFAAVKLMLLAGQVVRFDDVLTQLHTTGLGQLEIQSETSDVIVTCRVSAGGIGEFIPALPPNESNGPLLIPWVENDVAFRTNVGIAETSGHSGVVQIGALTVPIAPFSHVQLAYPATDETAQVKVISGEARVIAYASVVDNMTNDPVFVAAVPDVESKRVLFAPFISTAAWQTTTHFAGSSAQVTKPDFGIGILRVSGLIRGAAGRIANRHFGHGLPFANGGLTDGDILHAEVSGGFHSNLVVMNVGTADATVFVFEGLRLSSFVLAPMTIQFLPLGGLADRVHVNASTPVLAYASLIDDSTGDPMLIPMQ